MFNMYNPFNRGGSSVVTQLNGVSQNWYPSAPFLVSSSVGIIQTASRLAAHILIIGSARTIDALGTRVGTAGVGSEMKAGVYDATGTNGRPGNLLGLTSSVATTSSTTNVTLPLSASLFLPAGIYWAASVHKATTTLPITYSYTGNGCTLPGVFQTGGLVLSTAVNGSDNSGGMVYTDVTYDDALPATFGTATPVVSGTTYNFSCLGYRVL